MKNQNQQNQGTQQDMNRDREMGKDDRSQDMTTGSDQSKDKDMDRTSGMRQDNR